MLHFSSICHAPKLEVEVCLPIIVCNYCHNNLHMMNMMAMDVGRVKRMGGHGTYGWVQQNIGGLKVDMFAHRLAYCAFKRVLPETIKGQHCSHRCHNSLCVNGAHICIKTIGENNERKFATI